MITCENARELQLKGARAKVALRERRLTQAPAVASQPTTASYQDLTSDPLGEKLVRVQWQLVRKMSRNKDSKQVSALAQALKNVREVYHLVTGQAKPGVLKPEQGKRRQPPIQVAIEVDSDPIPQPIVPTSNPTPSVTDTDV